MVGSALVVSLRDSFSSCVSTREILWLLPLLWCEWFEWKLQVLFVLGRCWPGADGSGCAGSGCAVDDILNTLEFSRCW
jgi:hypothetical protein